jgi:hypothetical protein
MRGNLTTVGAVVNKHYFVYFNGMRVGDTGNGTPGEIDYATTINERGDREGDARVRSRQQRSEFARTSPGLRLGLSAPASGCGIRPGVPCRGATGRRPRRRR